MHLTTHVRILQSFMDRPGLPGLFYEAQQLLSDEAAVLRLQKITGRLFTEISHLSWQVNC